LAPVMNLASTGNAIACSATDMIAAVAPHANSLLIWYLFMASSFQVEQSAPMENDEPVYRDQRPSSAR